MTIEEYDEYIGEQSAKVYDKVTVGKLSRDDGVRLLTKLDEWAMRFEEGRYAGKI